MSASASTSATPTTLPEMIEGASHHPGTAIRARGDDGTWERLSYDELFTQARAIARGLVAVGIRPGERVAVIGATTRAWTLCDLGILCAGAVVVPVYHTNSPGECQYVLEHSGARAIFVEDDVQIAKMREVRDECPDLEHVISFGKAQPTADVIALEALLARGAMVHDDALATATAAVAPEDPATIVYTSGTTGPQKGCILTHANILATTRMYDTVLRSADEEPPVVFMFLPLAHVLARVAQFVTLRRGGEIAYWSGDTKRVLEDLQEIRPTHFPSVPRVFEKIHTTALAAVEEANPVEQLLFRRALSVGRRVRRLEQEGRTPGPVDRVRYAFAQKVVLKKVPALFGGNLQRAVTGAAPIGREVLDFFAACGITVLEGYGMTETCAAATLNMPDAFRFGTVGRPLEGSEVRIADDGEILMRGPHVSPGYLHNEEATRETFLEDGWMRSGDLGEIDDEGYVTITGRKKDLLITSSGKNIAPTNIETLLQETRWLSHAVVYGDNKPYLVALVTLDPDEATALAEHAGVDATTPEELADHPAVKALVRETVDEVNEHFAPIEQIKRFQILDHDLTEQAGELTPTMKVKRSLVYDRFREDFEHLYEE